LPFLVLRRHHVCFFVVILTLSEAEGEGSLYFAVVACTLFAVYAESDFAHPKEKPGKDNSLPGNNRRSLKPKAPNH
jgi:hypothetical protein